jgi:hypothetical protein
MGCETFLLVDNNLSGTRADRTEEFIFKIIYRECKTESVKKISLWEHPTNNDGKLAKKKLPKTNIQNFVLFFFSLN